MNKAKLQFLKRFFLLSICCIFVAVFAACSDKVQGSFGENQAKPSVPSISKQALARTVLTEFGIGQRYDLYFDHMTGALIIGSDLKMRKRFNQMFVREAGWKHLEDKYVATFEADFSEAELQELLEIAKRPAIVKLLQAEVKAYDGTASDRYKLSSNLWENYNNATINLPE
jgi:N-acyl-D-aspartate/D-glutamate deacylase